MLRLHRLHRLLPFLATSLAIVLLAACGSPSTGGPLPDPDPDPDPEPVSAPSISAVAPEAAARGQALTITGTNFGATEGALTVGGVPAIITSWSPTSIEATVPAEATNAWQDVAVTTTAGSATRSGLFVGVAFTGTDAELQGFLEAQEPGTAALLEARTYDIAAGAAPLTVTDLDLYGRGTDQTRLLISNAAYLLLLAEFGGQATLADLELAGGTIAFGADSQEARVSALAADIEPGALVNTEPAALTAQQLEQLRSSARATLVLRGLNLDGTGLYSSDFDHSLLFDLQVFDSVIEGSAIDVSLFGDALLDGVTANMSTVARLISLVGSLNVRNSSVTGPEVDLGASTGAEIVNSHLESTSYDIWLRGARNNVLPDGTQLGGQVTIRDSTLLAQDGDLTDATFAGSIRISTNGAPILLKDNPSIAAHGDILITNDGRHLGLGGVRVINNDEIRVGVFTEDDAANYRAGNLIINSTATTAAILLEVANNTLAVNGNLEVDSAGPRRLRISNNEGSLGDPSTAGGILLRGTGIGPITMVENRLYASGEVDLGLPDLNNTLFEMAGNTFRIVGAGPNSFYAIPTNGQCRFENNFVEIQSGANTPSFTAGCHTGTGPFDFTDNSVAVIGTMAGLRVDGNGISEMLVANNHFSTSQFLWVYSGAARADVLGNTFGLMDHYLELGNAVHSPVTTLHFEDNTITHRNPTIFGVHVTGVASVTMVDNRATVLGTPGSSVVALSVSASSGPIALTARENRFTNYSRALQFADNELTQNGMLATVTNNVFDFPIDDLAKSATLHHIGNPIIATNNQWGTNTDAAVVAGYVYNSGTTDVRGGTITVAPITLPPAP